MQARTRRIHIQLRSIRLRVIKKGSVGREGEATFLNLYTSRPPVMLANKPWNTQPTVLRWTAAGRFGEQQRRDEKLGCDGGESVKMKESKPLMPFNSFIFFDKLNPSSKAVSWRVRASFSEPEWDL